MMSRRRMLVAVLALVLALEGCARLGRISPRLWRPDPHVGHTLRAGAAGWLGAWCAVNGHGMRDTERTVARTPGRLRVAVLGDSVTEATHLPLAETYPALLETALTVRGQAVEVMNFGVGGYSTGQELLLYRHVVAAFKPDIVLLQFSAGNDVQQNHAPLGGESVRPYFRRDGRKVMPDERFRASAAHRRVAQPFLRFVDAASDWSHLVRALASRAVPLGYPIPDATDLRAFGPSPDDTWREAWVITERMLVEMGTECQANGARLMVLGATAAHQVHPDPATREALAQKLGQGDLLYPESRLAPFLVGNNVPFLPLAAVFQRRATANKTFYHAGEGPWTREGHALAAELVTPWLIQHLR